MFFAKVVFLTIFCTVFKKKCNCRNNFSLRRQNTYICTRVVVCLYYCISLPLYPGCCMPPLLYILTFVPGWLHASTTVYPYLCTRVVVGPHYCISLPLYPGGCMPPLLYILTFVPGWLYAPTTVYPYLFTRVVVCLHYCRMLRSQSNIHV